MPPLFIQHFIRVKSKSLITHFVYTQPTTTAAHSASDKPGTNHASTLAKRTSKLLPNTGRFYERLNGRSLASSADYKRLHCRQFMCIECNYIWDIRAPLTALIWLHDQRRLRPRVNLSSGMVNCLQGCKDSGSNARNRNRNGSVGTTHRMRHSNSIKQRALTG